MTSLATKSTLTIKNVAHLTIRIKFFLLREVIVFMKNFLTLTTLPVTSKKHTLFQFYSPFLLKLQI